MIDKLLSEYYDWFENGFIVNNNEIITPFVDNHNDLIHFRIEDNNQTIKLTDDGYTLNNLLISGFLFTDSRQRILDSILSINNLYLDENDCICAHFQKSNIGIQFHNYIAAIREIDNMIILSQQNIKSFFREDVEHFFTERNVQFNKNIRKPGKSGLEHYFDFQIEKTQKRPERIIRVLGSTDTKSVQSLLFSWNDVKQDNDYQMITILNDQTRRISNKMITAIRNYNVIPVEWKNREDALSVLIA